MIFSCGVAKDFQIIAAESPPVESTMSYFVHSVVEIRVLH